MSKIKTVISGESFTYEILWTCCRRQSALAKTEEHGKMYILLTSMSMAYFTYEAYLNHALHKVAPDIYQVERTYFVGPDYFGTPGKLKKLCELASMNFPDASNRPYQSIKLLQKLRDSVAHGKPDPFEETVKHRAGENPAAIPSSFEKIVSEANAERCIKDLEEFIKWLNQGLVRKFGSEGLLNHPLMGFLGHSNADYVEEP